MVDPCLDQDVLHEMDPGIALFVTKEFTSIVVESGVEFKNHTRQS